MLLSAETKAKNCGSGRWPFVLVGTDGAVDYLSPDCERASVDLR